MIDPIPWSSLVSPHAYQYTLIDFFGIIFNIFQPFANNEPPYASSIVNQSSAMYPFVQPCNYWTISKSIPLILFSANALTHESPVLSIHPPGHHLPKSTHLFHPSLFFQPLKNSIQPSFKHKCIHSSIHPCILQPLIIFPCTAGLLSVYRFCWWNICFHPTASTQYIDSSPTPKNSFYIISPFLHIYSWLW